MPPSFFSPSFYLKHVCHGYLDSILDSNTFLGTEMCDEDTAKPQVSDEPYLLIAISSLVYLQIFLG